MKTGETFRAIALSQPLHLPEYAMNNVHHTAVSMWASFARTARDLMTPDPVSISENATSAEAAAFLVESGISAAPVINEAGRPVGVLSRTDLVWHQGRKPVPAASEAPREEPPWLAGSSRNRLAGDGSSLFEGNYFARAGDGAGGAAAAETTTVREIMTPAIVSVGPEDPVEKVVRMLVGMEIHRLFVVDAAGVLVGVITTLDVLRSLCRPAG